MRNSASVEGGRAADTGTSRMHTHEALPPSVGRVTSSPPGDSLFLGMTEPRADPRWSAVIGCCVALLSVAAAVLWSARIALPEWPQVGFGQGGCVLTATGITAYLLGQQCRQTRSRPLVLLTGAYALAAFVQLPLLLGFAPLDLPPGLAFAVPDSSAWLWHAWHFGFAALACGYAVAERRPARLPPTRCGPALAMMVGAAFTATLGTALALAFAHAALPQLMTDAGRATPTHAAIGLVTAALLATALALLWRRDRRHSPLHAWLGLVLVALFADVVCGAFCGARFTLAWYGAGGFGLTGASLLLILFAREFGLLHRRLRVALNRLGAMNGALERCVDERTAELKAALDDVQAAHEQLRQSEKVRVVGQLAAGVAHDFNNILQVVSGALDVAQDRFAAGSEGGEYVGAAARAAERGARLTHQLLAYARKQLLAPTLLDLPELLGGLQSILGRTLGSRIRVQIEVARDVPLILADCALLQTALINLGINAAHAMPDGGVLQLSARAGRDPGFGELPPGDYAVVAAEDTGLGMTPDVIARAFEPFYTTKGVEGTGLGLAMVQGFSRQSGGDVRIESAPGRGTRVEIWLPAAQRGRQAPIAASRPRGEVSGSGRVLLVDDSPDVLLTVRAFLSKSGFAVTHASGGDEALGLLARGEPFDILITDYMMPGLIGRDLIEQARVMQPDLPVLIITGFSDVANFDPDRHHAAAIMRKPFKRDELVERVNDLLGAAGAALRGDPLAEIRRPAA